MVRGEERNGWSDIPGDLLKEILPKLTLLDYLKCRRVCRSWRRTVNDVVATKGTCHPAPQFPFLVKLPPNLYFSKPATLLDITQNTSYTIPIQSWKGYFEFDSVFSVQGWLVFQRIYYSQNYDLITFSNPLSGEEFELPHLPLFPSDSDVADVSVKLTFSSDSSDTLVVACATRPSTCSRKWRQQLAFCKVNDKSWTLIPKERHSLPCNEFVIVDWKLYAMYSNATYSVTRFNLDDSDIIASESLKPMSIREVSSSYDCMLARDGDEILLVIHCMDQDRRTSGFRVFKLDMSSRPRWIQVDDLGDRVVLIDYAGIQIISAKEINLHVGNWVFFCMKRSNLGVFSLKDKCFVSLPVCPPLHVSGRCLWFSPSLW